MISGTYTAQVETPIGTKRGTLQLREGENGTLQGSLTVLGGTTEIEDGKLQGAKLSFRGTLSVPFIGALPYTFEGEHEGSRITGVAHSKMGDIAISGTRE